MTAISMTYVSWPHRFVSPVAEIVQRGLCGHKLLKRRQLGLQATSDPCKLLIRLILLAWLTALDDFRNWLQLGL